MANDKSGKSDKAAARKSVFSSPLAREISIVLLVKFLAIIAIKVIFFSDPVDPQDSEWGIGRQLGILPQLSASEGSASEPSVVAPSTFGPRENHHDR